MKKQVPFSMAIEICAEFFPNLLSMGTARMKQDKDTEGKEWIHGNKYVQRGQKKKGVPKA